ncbi:MAG: tetratricopeptide repeat protein, partial [Armatimonadota bacterium]|nr:tetratricopeptide repeat protein [Armatimonadota bacterium]
MSKKRVLINLLAFLLTVFILASSAALATTREDAKLQYFRGINFGMNDKAIVEWQKVLTDFSDQREICADAQLQIGAAYKYMSRFDQAIVEFQKVVNDYPDQRYPRADALYYLGQLYQEKGDLSQAIAAFGSVVSEYSDMGWRAARAKLAMARALDLSGQTDAALEALNGTVMGYSSVRSVCAEAAVEIGQILVSDNKKNYDQAIIQFSEVLNEYKDERAACAQAL